MKKIISFIFIFIANVVLLAHAATHHHFDFVMDHSKVESTVDINHQHTASCCCHHAASSQLPNQEDMSQKCGIDNYAVINNQFKLTYNPDLNILTYNYLALIPKLINQDIFKCNKNKQSDIRTYYLIPFYFSHTLGSTGLRAPPFC